MIPVTGARVGSRYRPGVYDAEFRLTLDATNGASIHYDNYTTLVLRPAPCNPALGGDPDGDGWCNGVDNCPNIANASQADSDADGRGDACDNCPTVPNPDQADRDHDGIGDACDADRDGDGVPNVADCAPDDATRWRNQAFPDPDGDGVRNSVVMQTVACFGPTPPAGFTLNANGPDNCPDRPNPDQRDTDRNGLGDACDPCLADFNNDGGVDGGDVGDFFEAWELGAATADLNADGGVDGGDVQYFFARWERGC
ncbi:MAG: thrombospondin type 3 repeat-containing protein [Planctomycetes bacterium]|nr:thrombospondin type 3 repeat-containing protein [Planctomycetota bacterium]